MELDKKLAKDIIQSATSGKIKKSVVRFFIQYFDSIYLGYDVSIHDYYTLKKNKESIQKFLTIDWIFNCFVSADYGISRRLSNMYHWVTTGREYHYDRRPGDYIACFDQLNDLIKFRKILCDELFKITGPPKTVIIKMSEYRYSWNGKITKRRKYTQKSTAYGESFREIAHKVIPKRKDKWKIHSIKIYNSTDWFTYSSAQYKAWLEICEITGISSDSLVELKTTP
jgi:hypothetical protein